MAVPKPVEESRNCINRLFNFYELVTKHKFVAIITSTKTLTLHPNKINIGHKVIVFLRVKIPFNFKESNT